MGGWTIKRTIWEQRLLGVQRTALYPCGASEEVLHRAFKIDCRHIHRFPHAQHILKEPERFVHSKAQWKVMGGVIQIDKVLFEMVSNLYRKWEDTINSTNDFLVRYIPPQHFRLCDPNLNTFPTRWQRTTDWPRLIAHSPRN